MSLQGESLSADTSAVDDYRNELVKKMENEGTKSDIQCL